jgi:hypothetical protein
VIVGGVKRPTVVRARPRSSFQPPRPEVSVGRPQRQAPHPVARAKVVSRPPPAPPMRSTRRASGGTSYQSPDAHRDSVKALRTLRVINRKTGAIVRVPKVQRYASVEDWKFKAARAAQVRQTTNTVIDVRRAQGASAIQIANELVASKRLRIRNDFKITEDRFKRRGEFAKAYGYGPEGRRQARVDRGLGQPGGSFLGNAWRSAKDSLLGLPAGAVEIAKTAPELGQSVRYLEQKLGLWGAKYKGVDKPHTPHTDALRKGFEKASQQYAIADRLYHDFSVHGLKQGLEEARRRGQADPLSYSEWLPGLGAAGRVFNVAKHGSTGAATARAASYAGRAGAGGAKAARDAHAAARLAVQSRRELQQKIKLRARGQASDAEVEAAAKKVEQHAQAALPPRDATAVRARRYSRSPYVRVVQKGAERVQSRGGRDSRYKRGRAATKIVKRASHASQRRAASGGLAVEADVTRAVAKQRLFNGGIKFKNREAQQLHNVAVRFSHTGEVLPGRELYDLREIRDTLDAHIKEVTKERGDTATLKRNRAFVEKLASDFARHGDDSALVKARKLTGGTHGSKALQDAIDEDLVALGYVTKEQAQFRRKATRQFTHGNAAMGKRPDEREGTDLDSLPPEGLKAIMDNPDRSPGYRAQAARRWDARRSGKRERRRAETRQVRATRLRRERQDQAVAARAGAPGPAKPKAGPVVAERAPGRSRVPNTGPGSAMAHMEFVEGLKGKGKANPEPPPVKATPKPKPALHSGRDREHAMVETVHGYRKSKQGEVYVGRRTSEQETPFGNWVAAHKRSPAGVEKVADANTAIKLWHERKRGDDAFIKRGPELVGKRLLYPSRTKDLSHADVLGHWAERIRKLPEKERTLERLRQEFDGALHDWHGEGGRKVGNFERATPEQSRAAASKERKPVAAPSTTRPGRATGADLPAAQHNRFPSADETAMRHQFQTTKKGAERGKPQLNWPTKKLEREARKLVASGKHPARLNAMLLELEERRAWLGAGKRPGEIPKLLAELEKKHKQPELGRAEAIQQMRDNLGLPDEAAASGATEPLHGLFEHWASKLNGTQRSLQREGQHVGDAGLYHQGRVVASIGNLIHALNGGDVREAAVAARDVIEEISANADVERMRNLERSQPEAADNPWVGEFGSRVPNRRAVGKLFEQLDEIRQGSPSGRYTVGANLSEKDGGVRGERQAGQLFKQPQGKGTSPELATTMPMTYIGGEWQRAPLGVERPTGQAGGSWASRAELAKSRELDPSERPELSSGEQDFAAPNVEAHTSWEEQSANHIKNLEQRVAKHQRTGDRVQLELARSALAAARAEELPVAVAEAIANAIEDRLVHERGHRPEPAALPEPSAKVKRMEESGDFAEVRSKPPSGMAARVEAMRRDFRKARNDGDRGAALVAHGKVLRTLYSESTLAAIAKRLGRELSKEDGWFNPFAKGRLTRPDELGRAIESELGGPRNPGDHAELYAHLADATEKALDDEAPVPLKEWWSPYFRRDVAAGVRRGMRLTSKSPVHEGSAFHFRPRADTPGLAREKSSGQGFSGRSALYEDMGAADIKSSLLHSARMRGQALLSKAMLSFSYHGKSVPAHTVDLKALEQETGFEWALVKARRRDQPGTLTPRLEELEDHSALFAKPARDDMVYAIPKATRDVWAQGLKRPGALVQSGQWLTRAFVRGVLPFAATWHAGNFADQQLRLLAMGPQAVLHGSAAHRALEARLAEGDLPAGLKHDVLAFALGHGGHWSSVPRPRLAEILEGKKFLGSFGHAATRLVARRGHDGWEPKFFAKALGTPADLMLHLGGKWERGPVEAQVGAHMMAQYQRMHGTVADYQTMARTMVDHWQQHPELLDEFQNEVLQTVGDWVKNNKAEVWAGAGAFPFVKWMENALKWTLWTTPLKHPNAVTAAWLIAAMTREQRAKLGLEYWHTPKELYRMGLPKPQLPGNVVVGGRSLYLGSFFSPTEAGQFVENPAKWAAGKAFPMFQGPVAAAMTGNRYFDGSEVANPQRSVWDAKQARKDIELVQHTLQSQGGGPVFILKGSSAYHYKILRYEQGRPVVYEIEGRRKKWDKQPYNKGILGHDYVRGLLQGVTQFLPAQKELTSHNIFPGTYGHWRITNRRLGSSIYNPLQTSVNRAAIKGEGNRLGKGYSRAEDIRYSSAQSPFRVGSQEDDRKRKAKVLHAKRQAVRGQRRYAKGVRQLKATRHAYKVKAEKVKAEYGPQGLLEKFGFRPEGTHAPAPTLAQMNRRVRVKKVKRSDWTLKQERRVRGERAAHRHHHLTKDERGVVSYYDKQIAYRTQKIAKSRDFAGESRPGGWPRSTSGRTARSSTTRAWRRRRRSCAATGAGARRSSPRLGVSSRRRVCAGRDRAGHSRRGGSPTRVGRGSRGSARAPLRRGRGRRLRGFRARSGGAAPRARCASRVCECGLCGTGRASGRA